jgi:two-component system osmolarity sensor histidine kinase EnvZ
MLVLISVHACVTLLVSDPAAGSDDRALQTAVFTGRAFADDPLDNAGGTWGAPVAPVSLVPATMKLDLAARPRIVDVRPAVYEVPAAGALMDIAAPSTPGSSNGLHDDSPFAGDAPAAPLDSRFAVAEWVMSLVMLILACLSLWRVQRPLRNVAHAARETACGRRVAPTVREEGPSELRHVVRAFNEMARRRNEAIEAQAAVLAGLARHMECQAARLRTRALEVSEWNKRVGFVEDIDSFSDIAQQLLDVAGHGDSEEQQVSVDSFLRDRFSMIGTMDGALFACDLKAGPQFMMSRPLLERLMTNLVDNALAHGEPPIEIRTLRDQHGWHLSVRDHGPGISASQMPGATPSFVRLNETHSLTQHWGLGLSVVARLARSCGASLKLGNHPDGGLWVRLVLPAN